MNQNLDVCMDLIVVRPNDFNLLDDRVSGVEADIAQEFEGEKMTST